MQRVKRKATEPKKIPVVEKKKENSGEKKALPVAAKISTVESPGHPSTGLMVMKAIEALDDKDGVSLQAIKKFILENNDVNMKRQAPLIRRALKKAVDSGTLVQTKGRGANGSFKLAPAGSAVPEKKSPPTKKTEAKKPVAAKKTTAKPKITATLAKSTAVPVKIEESENEEMEAGDIVDPAKEEEPAVEEAPVKTVAKVRAKPTKVVKPAKQVKN